jgi:S1-C subfamily serine protease
MEPRRILLFIIVGFLGAYAWYRYDHRLPRTFTPADATRVTAEEVKTLATLDAERVKLVDSVVPSVVSITSSGAVLQAQPITLEDYLRGSQRAVLAKSTSLGSGVIVSKEGHILTNHHVIAGKTEIHVQLTDGRNIVARLIGSDPATDIAVLQVNEKNLEPLPFGNSDDLRAGQEVLAVGNPYGFEGTVSRGIVSSTGRRTLSDSGMDFIQHDAVVNQGNSGGPLLNSRGEIVGMNSRIFSQTGGWQGISFAIPSKKARQVMEMILSSGRYTRRYLGVMMQSLTPAQARVLEMSDTNGALITAVVPDSPGARAGLQRGDVVRVFNGRTIGDAQEMSKAIAEAEVGKPVSIELLRKGQAGKTTATLTEIAPEAVPVPQPGTP